MFKLKKHFFPITYVFMVFISTISFAFIATVISPFSFNTRYSIINFYSKFNLWTLKCLCNIDYRVEGKENIPNESCIIFSKHQSAVETLMFQQIFPPLTFVVKKELLLLPFFGWGLKALNPIAINRKARRKAILQVVEQGINRLAKGIWVVIFPEGTRSLPGTKLPYKKGGAILATKSDYKVIPVAHTAGEFWPKGFFSRQTGTIIVSIGPFIEAKDKKIEAIMSEAENWIETKMKEISTIESYPEY